MTFAIVGSITAYACVTKKDYTSEMGGIVMGGSCFLMMMLFLVSGVGIFSTGMCVFSAITFGFYLLYDT